MRFKLSAVVANIVVLLVEIASPAFGQGNLTGFDTEKSVTLHGTVNRVEWINPNTWIHVALKTANGAKEDWRIAAGSPNILLRRGLTKESLKTGTEIVVEAYPAKNGSLMANGRDLMLPDGSTISIFATRSTDGKDVLRSLGRPSGQGEIRSK